MNDQQLRRALQDLPRHRPSDGFVRRTLARIDEDRAPSARKRPGRPSGWTRALVGAMAAAAMAAAAVVILTRLPAPDHTPARDTHAATTSNTPRTATGSIEPGGDAGRTDARSDRSPERQAALRELRAERNRLAAELDELKRQVRTGAADMEPPGLVAGAGRGSDNDLENEARFDASSGSPVLYLGGDDRVDLVLDLGRLAAERGDRATVTSRGGSS